MKTLQFTDDELRTLVWALNNESHRYTRISLEQGKKPQESETIKRLLNLSKKAYSALTHAE